MNVYRLWILIGLVSWILVNCTGDGPVSSGGGADVGNPFTGLVTISAEDGTPAAEAMVVISKRGADPGPVLVPSEKTVCKEEEGMEVCVQWSLFDTTFTDDNGTFRFDAVDTGRYVVVAKYKELTAIGYTEQRPNMAAEITLTVKKTAALTVATYDPLDTTEAFFNAVRIAGTGFINFIDNSGVLALSGIPAGTLDVILYRSDGKKARFESFRTEPGCSGELYTDPLTSASEWTPHQCGYRDPLGRPYVLESYLPAIEDDTTGYTRDGNPFDVRIIFSHGMNAVSTIEAVTCRSDDSTFSIGSKSWEGGNVLYLTFCVSDSTSTCISGESWMKEQYTYEVLIDTAAQTDLGVHFAHQEVLRLQ